MRFFLTILLPFALAGNPLLMDSPLPRFDLIEPHHIEPAFDVRLKQLETQLQALEKAPSHTWDSLVTQLERVYEEFHAIVGPVVHLTEVMNTPELRVAWEKVEPAYIRFLLRITQSKPLYTALNSLKEHSYHLFSPAQKRVIDNHLLAAQLSGAALSQDNKQRLQQIRQRIKILQTQFKNNLLDATKAYSFIVTDSRQLKGVPTHILQLTADAFNQDIAENHPRATPKSGPWKLSLEQTVFWAILKHSSDATLRETLWRAYMTRASSGKWNNTPIILEQLALKKEYASLIGFPSYAHLSIAKKAAENPDHVHRFLEERRLFHYKKGEKEFQSLQSISKASGFSDQLMPWDIAYFSERLREQTLNVSEEMLTPYFQLPYVLNAFFSLTHKLFGISFERSEESVPVWHSDVSYYTIKNENGTPIASFYLDPYARPETKRGGAWVSECKTRFRVGNTLQLPVAYMCCNGSRPINGKPSLLTFSDLKTLFHEFGHVLQTTLTTIDHSTVSGINGIEWDAVEIASQFMENWCYYKPLLKQLSRHAETGKPLPEEVIDKLIASKTFLESLFTLRQLYLGMLDMTLHAKECPQTEKELWAISKKIADQTILTPHVPEARFLCMFSHLFAGGYAAGYYGYQFSKALSDDAFSAFEETHFKQMGKIGQAFKTTFLEMGGSVPPLEVFAQFRGRAPHWVPDHESSAWFNKSDN